MIGDRKTQGPSANLVFAVVVLLLVLVFFSLYEAYPGIFPAPGDLPPPP